jgi:hypothetical protein
MKAMNNSTNHQYIRMMGNECRNGRDAWRLVRMDQWTLSSRVTHCTIHAQDLLGGLRKPFYIRHLRANRIISGKSALARLSHCPESAWQLNWELPRTGSGNRQMSLACHFIIASIKKGKQP